MRLQEIFMKHNISLFDDKENLRNPIDIIEDMYLKLNTFEFTHIMHEISEEEKYGDIFNEARKAKYRGV